MDNSGGVSRFSVEHFLLHSAENFRRGEHFSVSLISGMENVWVRGGGYQKFPSKIICLTVSTVLVKEPFGVSLNSGTENVYASEGYVTTFVFLSKIFCLIVPKCFVGEPLCAMFHKISGSEKLYG